MTDRDCANCKHHTEDGCSSWCCEYEPKDLISRADAIEAVKETKPIVRSTERNWGKMIAEQHSKELVKALKALPSAEAEPTVIRSKTLLPTKDFKEWAKRIREVNPNAVVIPYEAEVVSAYAEPKWNCTANFVAEQLERLKDMTDEERLKLLQTMFSSAEAVQGEWIDIDNHHCLATCSHCRKVTMFEKWGEYIKPYDFCPNCGARMTPYKGGDSE